MSKLYFPLSSLEDYISEIKLQLENLGKEYVYYYRGCSNHGWKYNLTPGIYRDKQIFDEDINFREMILRSPNDFLNEKSTLKNW